MGAETFTQAGKGKTLQEAFDTAVESAAWEHGHGGYTGTLAEKHCVEEITVPEGMSAKVYANALLSYRGEQAIPEAHLSKFHKDRERINDKWGPAGAVKLSEGEWLFFGWASS